MTKKRKHYETCPHCAFVHAFMTKYPTAKKRESGKGFDHMVKSAINVAVLAMRNMDGDSQKEFMRAVLERSLQVSTLADIVAKMEAAKEPTKH